ncbi:MAG TPA: histidinol-phosphatase HisJ family protein [Syntrophomonadaceae bacterium]|nr:histidinol-phosphatase HisJ family protein [Syntrophomonadaceae bacterium]
MKLDYHIHAIAHGEYKYTLEWLTRFINQAQRMGIDEIGFSEHDDYLLEVDIDLIREVQGLNSKIGIKLGLEVDYELELNQDIKKMVQSNYLDYLIGSVHFIDGWAFDHPDHKHKFNEFDIDIVYQSYYDLVDKAARSKQFDIIGHLDLIKIWGHKPKQKDVLQYVEPVLSSIKEAGLVIEINTAGLRKPVQEIYPQYEVIELMKKMDIPITLGSDAHHPSQVGLDIDKAVFLAKRAGYKNIVSFNKREKIIIPF